MYQIIIDLTKLEYIRNPCKKCLVQPACKKECYKLRIHLESKDTIYATLLAGLITGNIFAWIKNYFLMRS